MRPRGTGGATGLDALLLGIGPDQAIVLASPGDLAGAIVPWQRPEGEADLEWDDRAPWPTGDDSDAARLR